MKVEYADLHIHTVYSDSDNGVENVFSIARKKGLACVAITDHDTVKSVDLAFPLSEKFSIEFIPGIEITAEKDNREIHILGYFIDYENPHFLNILKQLYNSRKERVGKIIERLHSLGIQVDTEELENRIGEAVPTRLHVALYLLEKNYVGSVGEAFRRYLGQKGVAYVQRERCSVLEAIKIIKDAGGLSFLAHPHYVPDVSWIEEFVTYGLDGIEVMYPRYSTEMIKRFSGMAEEFGLLKSGGSDSHGSYRDFTGVGEVKIPYEWVDKIKNAKPRETYTENI